VDGTPAGETCDAGNLVRPSDGGHFTYGGDLIQCGPALTDEENLK